MLMATTLAFAQPAMKVISKWTYLGYKKLCEELKWCLIVYSVCLKA